MNEWCGVNVVHVVTHLEKVFDRVAKLVQSDDSSDFGRCEAHDIECWLRCLWRWRLAVAQVNHGSSSTSSDIVMCRWLHDSLLLKRLMCKWRIRIISCIYLCEFDFPVAILKTSCFRLDASPMFKHKMATLQDVHSSSSVSATQSACAARSRQPALAPLLERPRVRAVTMCGSRQLRAACALRSRRRVRGRRSQSGSAQCSPGPRTDCSARSLPGALSRAQRNLATRARAQAVPSCSRPSRTPSVRIFQLTRLLNRQTRHVRCSRAAYAGTRCRPPRRRSRH